MMKNLIAVALGVALFGFAGTGQASAQYYAGYGNGGHDLAPHPHIVQTPFGSYGYYGNGAHDLYPHGHSASPYGGVHSYSNGPFSSTTSFNGYPGYGGYNGYNGYNGSRRFGFRRGYRGW